MNGNCQAETSSSFFFATIILRHHYPIIVRNTWLTNRLGKKKYGSNMAYIQVTETWFQTDRNMVHKQSKLDQTDIDVQQTSYVDMVHILSSTKLTAEHGCALESQQIFKASHNSWWRCTLCHHHLLLHWGLLLLGGLLLLRRLLLLSNLLFLLLGWASIVFTIFSHPVIQ